MSSKNIFFRNLFFRDILLRNITPYAVVLLLVMLFFSLGCTEKSDDGPAGPQMSPPLITSAEALSDATIKISWRWEGDYFPDALIETYIEAANTWEEYAVVSNNGQEFYHISLLEGTTHRYRLRGRLGEHYTDYTEDFTVTTLPKCPLEFWLEWKTQNDLELSWSDNSEVEDLYIVQRSVNQGGEYSTIAELDMNSTIFTDSDLVPDSTYFYRICCKMGEIQSAWTDVASTLRRPRELIISALSDTSVQLSWLEDARYQRVIVERVLSGEDDWREVAEISYRPHTFDDTLLTEGTGYQYRVRGYAFGGISPYSELVTVTTFPAAPRNLEGNPISNSELVITWEDRSHAEDGFEMERSRSEDGGFVQIERLNPGTVTWVDGGLEAETSYYYRVRSWMANDYSAWSNVCMTSTVNSIPEAPVNFRVESVTLEEVHLVWEDVAEFETGFLIERETGEIGGWIQLASISANFEEYTDLELQLGETYQYRICSQNLVGNSEWVESDEVIIPTELLSPAALEIASYSLLEVHLVWEDRSDNETGFLMARKTGVEAGWRQIDSLDANLVEYMDENVLPGEAYQYRICSYNPQGSSVWVESVGIVIPTDPSVPGNLVAEVRGTDAIQLSWDDRSEDEDGFIIERMIEGSDRFNEVDLIRGTTWLDEGLEEETLYSYRVRAFWDEGGVSEYSNIASARTWSVLVFYDSFEDYQSGLLPDNPAYQMASGGTSMLSVSTADHHDGSKSLHFQDSRDGLENYIQCTLAHRRIVNGLFSCWVKMSDNGLFGIIGSDDRNIKSFQIQFNEDNTYDYRDAGNILSGQGYPVNRWFSLRFEYSLDNHTYKILFDDEIVIENLSIYNQVEYISRVHFICYQDGAIDNAYIDELEVLESGGQGFLLHPLEAPEIHQNAVSNPPNLLTLEKTKAAD